MINTMFGMVFSVYEPFNLVMADASILISIGLFFGAYKSSMPDGFKIGLTILFAITGLIRFVCSVISPDYFKNNLSLLVFVVFLSGEFLMLFVGKNLKDK